MRAQVDQCPFCDAESPAPFSPIRAIGAHLSRAAILAGATALGCGSGSGTVKPDENTRTTDNTRVVQEIDVRDRDHQPRDAGTAVVADGVDRVVTDEEERRRLEEQERQDRMHEEMEWRQRNRNCDRCPYGAPPPPRTRATV